MNTRFCILTFPQRFVGDELRLHFLLLPRLSGGWYGDPNVPVMDPDSPSFATAEWKFEARILAGLDDFPHSRPADRVVPLPTVDGTPTNAPQLLTELAGIFTITDQLPRMAEEPKKEIFIKKYLPGSYRESFLFTGPRTADAVTDNSYQCAIKADDPPNQSFDPTPNEVSWGQVYAYCLRNPLLARGVGLVREVVVPLEAEDFENGGYIYVDLAAGSAYHDQATADYDVLRRYAARIPRRESGEDRPLFAATQFRVLWDDENVPGPPAAPPGFDPIFLEAAEYDDGFAKVVHGTQPVSQDLLAEDPDGFTPLTDIGIRLGWDDEQILIWQNRQLKEDPANAGNPLDAPMGILAYRLDVREYDTNSGWTSLVDVHSKAPLQLGQVNLGPFEGELGVEVHPMQLDGNQESGQFWLPAYMAQWSGSSVVLPDEDAAELFRTTEDPYLDDLPGERPPGTDNAVALAKLYQPRGQAQVELRYGHTYDFRVRMMDPTGGGPVAGEEPVYESPAPVATVPFRRHVVPEPVRVDGGSAEGTEPEFFLGDSMIVKRPLLGYPAVVFTDKYTNPVERLRTSAVPVPYPDDPDGRGQIELGIPDPDVARVRIEVEVKALELDNLLSLSGREPYIHLYTTHRDFPADFDDARTIPLEFRDAPVLKFGDPNDLGDLGLTGPEIDGPGLDELVLPAARDIRLTVRAVGAADATYFAPEAHIGKPIQVKVRRESAVETDLFADTSAAKRIRGIYLQPDPEPVYDGDFKKIFFKRTAGDDPVVIQRLAQQLGVDNKGLTLVGKRGERVVFGCSRRIRHTLAPDDSSLTFAAKEDLYNHWVVAITLRLDRDWTWDSLEPVSFEIFRERQFAAESQVQDNGGDPIGDWEVKPAASAQALAEPQRGSTTLIFLDAVEPKAEGATGFPDRIELTYRVETRFRSDSKEADEPEILQLELPVTTKPAQIPRIASAGVALSRYARTEDYSATDPRQRFLWLELAEPVKDPNDAYFIRLKAYAADPLLSDNRAETYIAPEEPALPVDPELIRVIVPDHSDDGAGLDAMMPLEPAGNSDRHFLVPLPPGLHAESPELFGMFTYELRVGHAHIWSTAQGRFGIPLEAKGVQHPAPTLFCTCHRWELEVFVEATYAQAVLNGKKITAQPPRTEIWALLYAQVHQADGKDHRNILLDDRKLEVQPRPKGKVESEGGQVLSARQNPDAAARGLTSWRQAEILRLLRELGLSYDSPLSVLCVEMMPAGKALLPRRPSGHGHVEDPVAAVHSELAGLAGAAGVPETEDRPRPLSDALGHFRILRTSSLVPVPAVCLRAAVS